MNLSLCSKNLVQDALNPLNYKASLADPKILHFPTFLLQFSTRFVPIPYLICSLLRGTIIIQIPRGTCLLVLGKRQLSWSGWCRTLVTSFDGIVWSSLSFFCTYSATAKYSVCCLT